MRDNERIFCNFALITGLRISEAIDSFNLIIKLQSEGKLDEYYDESLSCLQHFKYKELFIRRTKSTYISFVSVDFVKQIARSRPVSYSAIKKNIERRTGSYVMKFNLCRDYFGTHLLKNGILQEEVNLLQGRIPTSIFIKHYWSPSFRELRDRTLKAVSEIL
jgi:intergrase/recombinase